MKDAINHIREVHKKILTAFQNFDEFVSWKQEEKKARQLCADVCSSNLPNT